MQAAATTSPFTPQETDNVPWILWTQKEPVTHLQTDKQTDSRFAFDFPHDISTQDLPEPSLPMQNLLQTNRYHSVLSRMEQASKRAAAFSAWKA